MVRRAQREPPHVFHSRRLKRGDRVLDVLRVLVFEVVVPDRDDHIRPELRAQRLRELHDARRAHAVDRAALPFDATARRDLQFEVDALADDRDRAARDRDRVRDRVADQRHVLHITPSGVRHRRTDRERSHRTHEDPPHTRDGSDGR